MRNLTQDYQSHNRRQREIDEHKGPKRQHLCQTYGVYSTLVRRHLTRQSHYHREGSSIKQNGHSSFHSVEKSKEAHFVAQHIDQTKAAKKQEEKNAIEGKSKIRPMNRTNAKLQG